MGRCSLMNVILIYTSPKELFLKTNIIGSFLTLSIFKKKIITLMIYLHSKQVGNLTDFLWGQKDKFWLQTIKYAYEKLKQPSQIRHMVGAPFFSKYNDKAMPKWTWFLTILDVPFWLLSCHPFTFVMIKEVFIGWIPSIGWYYILLFTSVKQLKTYQ